MSGRHNRSRLRARDAAPANVRRDARSSHRDEHSRRNYSDHRWWPAFLNPSSSRETRDRPLTEQDFAALWPSVTREAERAVSGLLSASQSRFADDVVQEVALALLRALRRGRVRAAVPVVRRWIWRTATRISRAHRRRAARLVPTECDRLEALRSAQQAHEQEGPESASLVARDLAQLSPRETAVVRLRFAGKSHAEVSTALGITEGHCRIILHRALRRTPRRRGGCGTRPSRSARRRDSGETNGGAAPMQME